MYRSPTIFLSELAKTFSDDCLKSTWQGLREVSARVPRKLKSFINSPAAEFGKKCHVQQFGQKSFDGTKSLSDL